MTVVAATAAHARRAGRRACEGEREIKCAAAGDTTPSDRTLAPGPDIAGPARLPLRASWLYPVVVGYTDRAGASDAADSSAPASRQVTPKDLTLQRPAI